MKTIELKIICREVIDAFPDKVNEYRAGKKSLLGFFCGEGMKRSRGAADPKELTTILKEMLNEKSEPMKKSDFFS